MKCVKSVICSLDAGIEITGYKILVIDKEKVKSQGPKTFTNSIGARLIEYSNLQTFSFMTPMKQKPAHRELFGHFHMHY